MQGAITKINSFGKLILTITLACISVCLCLHFSLAFAGNSSDSAAHENSSVSLLSSEPASSAFTANIEHISNAGVTDYIACSFAVCADGTAQVIGSGKSGGPGAIDPQTDGTIKIPSTVTDANGTMRNVSRIGAYAFGGAASKTCTQLVAVELPSTIQYIDNFAFYSCSSLTNINFPEGLTTIGTKAFQSCTSLTETTDSAGELVFLAPIPCL